MSTESNYRAAFLKTFGIDESALGANPGYQSFEEWDSVGHMALMTELEDTFEIEMDIDDIIDFTDFETGKDILAKYGVLFDS